MSWHPDSTNTTTAEATVEALRLLEVQRVFGLPGIQNIELFDAFTVARHSPSFPTPIFSSWRRVLA